ncbi:MAG: hypothetical protein KGD59_04645 [Candidatus Heimdallarchaeota archaeon]|nr:hypothetical protein [Candidatus Heimdallarchaeota archaeon]MBY8993816.1 hypothetical protein [Candidatus Heimdallarchaeota archaeon]
MMNDKFIKICGISSIIATLSYIGTVIFILIAGIGKPESLATMDQYLLDWSAVSGLMSVYGWFGILGSLFTIPAILGYYQLLRKEGPMQWIPAAIIYHGVVLLTLAYIIPLVISHFIAPTYLAESDPSILASLQVLTHTLRVIEDFFIIIGTILTLTTGLAILALIDLKRSILPKWLNWLAIGTGVLGLGLLGTLGTGVVKQVFDIVTMISLGLMLLWMAAIGIIMIIRKEDDVKAIEGK